MHLKLLLDPSSNWGSRERPLTLADFDKQDFIWKEIADVGGLVLASVKFPNKMKEHQAEKKKKMKSAA